MVGGGGEGVLFSPRGGCSSPGPAWLPSWGEAPAAEAAGLGRSASRARGQGPADCSLDLCSFGLLFNFRQGAVSLSPLPFSPLPSPPPHVSDSGLRTVSPLEAWPHQTLQRLSQRGAGASCEALTALTGRLQRQHVTGGPAPLQRGLITLRVIPLRKGLLITEGRDVPFEGRALPSSLHGPPPPDPLRVILAPGRRGAVGAGRGRAQA